MSFSPALNENAKDAINKTNNGMNTENIIVGIDRINFATPHYYLDMEDLALARNVDPNKYTIGIGQSEQAVPPSNQDIVTLGAQAAFPLLPYINDDKLAMVIVGTESGVDASKSSALYIHNLLKLTPWLRCIEIKEACYGGTAALMTACDYVRVHADAQVLVIAADIARYGLNTPGEVTQGAGAVAMLVSANPHVLAINNDSIVKSSDVQDFWRPVYQDTALARGKFSTEQYIQFFCDVWQKYSSKYSLNFDDFAAMCFHLPYTKMGLKALNAAMDSTENLSESVRERMLSKYATSTKYSRRIGNIYTGSLYIGLLSLLELDCDCNDENSKPIKDLDRIGLFSYGSGAVGEFFSGTLMPGFRNALFIKDHKDMLDSRVRLSVEEYEEMFNSVADYSPEDFVSDTKHRDCTQFFLDSITNQERHYSSTTL